MSLSSIRCNLRRILKISFSSSCILVLHLLRLFIFSNLLRKLTHHRIVVFVGSMKLFVHRSWILFSLFYLRMSVPYLGFLLSVHYSFLLPRIYSFICRFWWWGIFGCFFRVTVPSWFNSQMRWSSFFSCNESLTTAGIIDLSPPCPCSWMAVVFIIFMFLPPYLYVLHSYYINVSPNKQTNLIINIVCTFTFTKITRQRLPSLPIQLIQTTIIRVKRNIPTTILLPLLIIPSTSS